MSYIFDIEKKFPKIKIVDKFSRKNFAIYITFCSFALQIKRRHFLVQPSRPERLGFLNASTFITYLLFTS